MKRSAPMKRSTPLRAKGGKARAETLSPERRREIASAAAVARWQAPSKPNAVMATFDDTVVVQPKPVTFTSEAWLAAVRSLTCCTRCGRSDLGIQAAHRNEGKGKGVKVHDCWTAALCPLCHFEIDQGKDMTREQRRAEIDRAIVITFGSLVLAGKVGLL